MGDIASLPSLTARRAKFGSRAEVAAYLGMPLKTLEQWAYKKIGPPYRIFGRQARYDWTEVEAWVKAQKMGGDAA